MMPNCDIEELKKEITELKEIVKILKNKLLQAKPELKEWVEKNFKGV